MRFILVPSLLLGLLVAQCASAIAAPAHHHARWRHALASSSRAMIPAFAGPARGINPNHPPVLEDQTPSYDDPSRQGGG